jgi:hypothetical protein
MIRSRLGLKALGLCALVLGLMAFASTAQAEVNAKWAIVKANGELITISPEGDGKGKGDTLLPEVKIKEIEGNDAILLTEVAKTKVALLCTNVAFVGNPKLQLEGKVSPAKVTFTGCITKLNTVTSAPCKPHSKGAAEGTITTETGKGLIQLSAGAGSEGATLITPETGETFVTIVLGVEGEKNECAIGEKLPVSGKLGLADCNKKFSTEEPEHLIVESTTLTDLWVLNKTAEHKATIDGSAWVKLGGEHEGLKWAGLPG